MTQCELILDYLDQNGSITPMEAYDYLGVTKLATRVSELSQQGVVLPRKMIEVRNRRGEKCHVMRYWRKDAMTCNSCGAIFCDADNEPIKRRIKENMDGAEGWEYSIVTTCPECGEVL